MKIVVAIKQVIVLDEDFELTESGDGVDSDFVEWDLNEWDRFALEAGLLLKEDGPPNSELVVASVGDENAREGLVTCLAQGADRALLVSDHTGLSAGDPMAVARMLAAAIAREEPDIVLCGVQSSDMGSGATGSALAALLGVPRVTVAVGLDYDVTSRVVVAEREMEGGLREVLRVPTPALLTVQTGANRPRYANLRAIKQARDKPIREVSIDELSFTDDDIIAARGCRLLGLAHPHASAHAEMIEGDSEAIAARIADIIKDRLGAGA